VTSDLRHLYHAAEKYVASPEQRNTQQCEARTSLYMKKPVKAISSCSVTAGDCWP